MRGNPVMKAKRVTGPTPNTVLLTHVKCERCYVKGCEAPVVLVRNPNGTTQKRACLTHVDGRSTRQRKIAACSPTGGWRPPWA